jgi:hypothetical protein
MEFKRDALEALVAPERAKQARQTYGRLVGCTHSIHVEMKNAQTIKSEEHALHGDLPADIG